MPLPLLKTNHLGPYTLTRLLEKKLIDSGARVVTVASVLHRMVTVKDALVREPLTLTDTPHGSVIDEPSVPAYLQVPLQYLHV